MTDSSQNVSSTDLKRALRRRLWLMFGAGLALVLIFTAILAPLSAQQVGIVNEVMTMVVCFLPLILVMALLWIGVAAAIFGISRLELTVTRQLASLEGRAHDAQTRARTAGMTVGKAVIRVVSRTAFIERWFSAFDPKPEQDDPHEQ